MARVLVVDERAGDARRISKIFQSVKVPVELAPNIEVAMERVTQDPPALVVVSNPDRPESLHSLNIVLREHAPATPFLVTLPEARLELALEAMQMGAFDCVSKPVATADMLMAAKRATLKYGRMLFVKKLEPSKDPTIKVCAALVGILLLAVVIFRVRQGPPPEWMSLGSVNLSGLQWEGRTLWVGDWFESTVTQYEVEKAVLKKFRMIQTRNIFRMKDGQPILMCNTPELMATIGSDLKIRIHQRSVGLPTFQTVDAPGVNPTGLAWDGKNIWSCDGQTNLLYKHGQDLHVIDTIKSIFPHPAGLAWDGMSLWVIGDNPLKAAQLAFVYGGAVWRGPVLVPRLLPEGVIPSGFAVGFNRLWAISGGDPKMLSVPMPNLSGVYSVKKLKGKEETAK